MRLTQGVSSRRRRPARRGAGKRHGPRWSSPLVERPWPVALGLLGLPWADGAGMGRLPPQPPANLGQAAASILEPEAPLEAIKIRTVSLGI